MSQNFTANLLYLLFLWVFISVSFEQQKVVAVKQFNIILVFFSNKPAGTKHGPH